MCASRRGSPRQDPRRQARVQEGERGVPVDRRDQPQGQRERRGACEHRGHLLGRRDRVHRAIGPGGSGRGRARTGVRARGRRVERPVAYRGRRDGSRGSSVLGPARLPAVSPAGLRVGGSHRGGRPCPVRDRRRGARSGIRDLSRLRVPGLGPNNLAGPRVRTPTICRRYGLIASIVASERCRRYAP